MIHIFDLLFKNNKKNNDINNKISTNYWDLVSMSDSPSVSVSISPSCSYTPCSDTPKSYYIESKKLLNVCPSCGAVKNNKKCQYCGTII